MTLYTSHTRDITIVLLLIKSLFITECMYGPSHRIRKDCNNTDFAPFYFKLDNFNVLKILLI